MRSLNSGVLFTLVSLVPYLGVVSQFSPTIVMRMSDVLKAAQLGGGSDDAGVAGLRFDIFCHEKVGIARTETCTEKLKANEGGRYNNDIPAFTRFYNTDVNGGVWKSTVPSPEFGYTWFVRQDKDPDYNTHFWVEYHGSKVFATFMEIEVDAHRSEIVLYDAGRSMWLVLEKRRILWGTGSPEKGPGSAKLSLLMKGRLLRLGENYFDSDAHVEAHVPYSNIDDADDDDMEEEDENDDYYNI